MADLHPAIAWARQKWPMLPSETAIKPIDGRVSRISIPPDTHIDVTSVGGARMGVGFDASTGAVILAVDEADLKRLEEEAGEG